MVAITSAQMTEAYTSALIMVTGLPSASTLVLYCVWKADWATRYANSPRATIAMPTSI